jgi:hypothetical protein
MSTTEGKYVLVQGRIVWASGDLFKGKKVTEFGTQILKKNAQGEDIIQYGFGLAVPKEALTQTGPGQPGEIWAAMYEEAFKLYPSRQLPPSFAMKFKDGDGIDDQGRPFSQREGYAGHIVLALTTSLPIKWFKFENGQNVMVNEGIKCGDYVQVQVGVKAHGAVGQGKPGLYLNPVAVRFLGYGKEIVNAPSGNDIFGNQAPPLPPGASATPLAPAAGFPMQAAAPVPGAPQVAPPMPGAASVPAATPHYGVLPPQHQPPAGGAPMPPVAGGIPAPF